MKRTGFPRVISAKVPSGRVFASAWLPVQLVAEVFGPPDVPEVFGPADALGTVATWSFADESRKVRYAIVGRAGAGFKFTKSIEMDFVAPPKLGRSFFYWATDRLNLTHNGELPPAFLMAAR